LLLLLSLLDNDIAATIIKAGIKKGDVIIELGGNKVTDMMSYMRALSVFEAGNTRNPIATYDANAQKVVITYEDLGNSPGVGTVVSGTVSGSTITYNTPSVFANVSTQWTAQTYDPDTQKIVISYQDGSNSNYGTAVVYQTPFVLTNLTATNYLGISDGAYANNTTATVQVAGSVDDAQSGLTPGQQYFVQANGSIDTTADSPSVVAGTAVAATKLLIKG